MVGIGALIGGGGIPGMAGIAGANYGGYGIAGMPGGYGMIGGYRNGRHGWNSRRVWHVRWHGRSARGTEWPVWVESWWLWCYGRSPRWLWHVRRHGRNPSGYST